MLKISSQIMFDWVLSELRTAVKNIHAGAFAEESHYIKDYLQGLKKKLALRIYSKIENGIVNAPSQEKLCLILDYLDSKQSKGDSSINQLEKEHYVFRKLYNEQIFLNIWKYAINPNSSGSLVTVVLKYESKFNNKQFGDLNLIIDTGFIMNQLYNLPLSGSRFSSISVEGLIESKPRIGYPVNLLIDTEMSFKYQSTPNRLSPALSSAISSSTLNTSWSSISLYNSFFDPWTNSSNHDLFYVETESLTSNEGVSPIDSSSGQSVFSVIGKKLYELADITANGQHDLDNYVKV
jgi:hypothetical protein